MSRTHSNFWSKNQQMNSAILVFICIQDQSKCSATKFKTQENNNKPLFLKDLRRVWDRFGTCFSCGKRKYDETNTLLVDDSPDKALCNPVSTRAPANKLMHSMSLLTSTLVCIALPLFLATHWNLPFAVPVHRPSRFCIG